MEDLKELLKTLSEAPDSQIDTTITDELKALLDETDITVIKKKVLECIDKCQIYSLASGFAIITMKTMYECFLDGNPSDYGARIISRKLS